MTRFGARRSVATIGLAAALAVTGCGSASEDVRNHIKDNYELVSEDGQLASYTSDEAIAQVADDISDVATPGREHGDDTGTYLGYKDAMVRLEPDGDGSGTQIEVTDPRDGYNRWGPAIIPIWGTFGGSYTSTFSGGGLGGGGK